MISIIRQRSVLFGYICIQASRNLCIISRIYNHYRNCWTIQYCAIETCGENEIPFHFPFISPTCFTQISEMGILWNTSLISPFFLDGEEFDFPVREFCSPIGETQLPNFPPIPPEFHLNFPRFPNDSYWFPVFPQFLIQLHKFTSSLSIRPFLWILHVSLKIRIHYARQRILNLGEFRGILKKSDEVWIAQYCTTHWSMQHRRSK